jgi:GNAT superfamily N-acetyltransferase
VIRDATVADLPAISWLAYASKAHWGYDEAFMAACVHELTVLPAHLDTHVVRVAERGGELAGFHGIARADGDLTWLFVAPDAMGHGIGRALFADACAVAARAGHGELQIEADPNARAFYERCGATYVRDVPSGSIPGRALPFLVCPVS